eukprot:TRINITY_DN2268_c0_g2_i1.p1 TRINITY_DN2268_c0_g2~~TRINITY_DN2268_c0_g2_i1.p1  ORF type:complete len:762 (-),score=168.38 TRINITY_DN2268_c0_g2_i1:98-2359(-)
MHTLVLALFSLLSLTIGQETVQYDAADGWSYQCDLERDILYDFNNIAVLRNKTIGECCEACWDSDLCVLWTWSPTDHSCALKVQQEGDGIASPGMISGHIGLLWETNHEPSPGTAQGAVEVGDSKVETLTNSDIEIYLWGSDIAETFPDLFEDKVVSTSSVVVELPKIGELVQNDNGQTRVLPGATVTDPLHRIIFRSPRALAYNAEQASTFFRILTEITFEDSDPLSVTFKVQVNIRNPRSFECKGSGAVPMGEVGTITITDDPVVVQFKNKYVHPVVISQPLSFSGKTVAITRITSVHNENFTIAIHEPSYLNGDHKKERVSYLVLESGSWTLPSGNRIEVGKHVTSATVGNEIAEGASWTTVKFPAENIFKTSPVVFTQTQTYNDQHWVATRQMDVNSAGFKVSLEEEELNEETHGGEVIGWVAFEKIEEVWQDSLQYEVNTISSVTNDWSTIKFAKSHNGKKSFLASIQTWAGADSAHLRYKDLEDDSVKIKVEEEESADEEKSHPGEVVGYILIAGEGTLRGVPGDCSVVAIAEDKDEEAFAGQVAKFQLLKKDQFDTTKVYLNSLPTQGVLFQYSEGIDLDQLPPISAPTYVKDHEGRVLYFPSPGIPGDTRKSYIDSFTYTLVRGEGAGEAKSNVAEVEIQVFTQDEIVDPRPPQPPHFPPSIFGTHDYQVPFMAAVGLCLILATVVVVLSVFLYKKRYGASDLIGFFKRSEDGSTYFPSGDDDSLTSAAETNFGDHSDTTDSDFY